MTSYAVIATLAVTLAGCAGDDGKPGVSTSSTAGDSSTARANPTSGDSATPDDNPTTTPSPSESATNLLDWQPTDNTVENDTVGLQAIGKRRVAFRSADDVHINGFNQQHISDLLLDGATSVVVLQDARDEDPAQARIATLGGKRFQLDGSSEVPTTNGGTWAIGQGKVFHASYGPKNAYCLAEVDLATQKSAIAWCAPKDQGFNDARITPAGLTVLSFTLGKDGCRTPITIAHGVATPVDGPTKCIGWDSLLTPQGLVWSETPDANHVEQASFFAIGADGTQQDLGNGDTGSLTWCGTSAYFTQQPQTDGDPARLLRWTKDRQLETVYETPGSPGFLGEPRCGGSRITIDAKSEGGDEHVSAPVD
jgi:hypothetical protein